MKTSTAARAAAFAMTVCLAVLGLGPAGSVSAQDYPPTSATVGGHIYLDANGNGTQDPGETDLAGVDVVVTFTADDCNDFAEAICNETVTTDANGNWTAVVAPGEGLADIVDSTLPAGVVQTEGTDPTTFTAVAGQVTDAGNDGFSPAASLFGHIYLDSNGNGVQDPGEPDLPGVDVIITDSNGNTTTVTADSDGNWMSSVPPGTVTVTIDTSTLPEGVTLTEGSNTYSLTVQPGSSTNVGRNGYTASGGTIPGTGSDGTVGGLRLGLGLAILGLGLVAVTRVRRRQPLPA